MSSQGSNGGGGSGKVISMAVLNPNTLIYYFKGIRNICRIFYFFSVLSCFLSVNNGFVGCEPCALTHASARGALQ